MKDFKEEIAKPRMVALYASLDLDYVTVNEVVYYDFDEHYQPLPQGEKRERLMHQYVRISEPVATTFAAVSNDEVVQHAVACLDAEERKVINELNTKLTSLRERKQQLLAITFQPEVSA